MQGGERGRGRKAGGRASKEEGKEGELESPAPMILREGEQTKYAYPCSVSGAEINTKKCGALEDGPI